MSHHYSTTAIIRCSDDRYHKGRELYNVYMDILKIEDVNPNDPYKIFKLGSAIDFQVDPNCKAHTRMIKALKKLGITKVVLVEHTPGCGGYEIDFGHISEEEEEKLHRKTIDATKAFFAKNLPDIQLICYLQIGFDSFVKID